jgi:hypothetical protein
MKKFTKTISLIISGFILLFVTTAFMVTDDKADYIKEDLSGFEIISLSAIETDHTEMGNFKTSVNFRQISSALANKEFYGQEIRINNNPKIDRILIGVTNNLISRIEVWNKDRLLEIKELGFMNKMTWNDTQTMTVQFYDQTNFKHNGKSKIAMRFYSGTGFFGDIGTINLDLTAYGDLSADKEVLLFSKSLKSNKIKEPSFSNLQIWKNYKSFD